MEKSLVNIIIEANESDLPSNIELQQFNTVVIWCESFEEFITSAKYR